MKEYIVVLKIKSELNGVADIAGMLQDLIAHVDIKGTNIEIENIGISIRED